MANKIKRRSAFAAPSSQQSIKANKQCKNKEEDDQEEEERTITFAVGPFIFSICYSLRGTFYF
jgi:hypothetical protein